MTQSDQKKKKKKRQEGRLEKEHPGPKSDKKVYCLLQAIGREKIKAS